MKELTVTSQLPIVTMNYEEVKESLTMAVEKYKVLVVTEQGLKDCKATQKELASIRTKIDTYRKSIKKEMEVPIKSFESQCKELIGLVVAAEDPIKQGILVFDNQKKQEKAEVAEEYLIEAKKGLNDYYKSKIDISDITINLSNSMKSIYEEIDSKVATLAAEQKAEEIRKMEGLEAIKATLENVNKTLENVQLEMYDFEKLIEMNWSAAQIITEINSRANRIKELEENSKKKEEQRILKLKADQEAATLKAEEDAEVRILYLQKQEKEKQVAKEKEYIEMTKNLSDKMEEERKRNQVADKVIGEPILFGVIRVVDTRDRMNALIKFLKDNEYEFNIESKGSVK